MAAGPLDQLEQTLERSIENVRQVCWLVEDGGGGYSKMIIIPPSGENCGVRFPAPGPARLDTEVTAGCQGFAGD